MDNTAHISSINICIWENTRQYTYVKSTSLKEDVEQDNEDGTRKNNNTKALVPAQKQKINNVQTANSTDTRAFIRDDYRSHLAHKGLGRNREGRSSDHLGLGDCRNRRVRSGSIQRGWYSNLLK